MDVKELELLKLKAQARLRLKPEGFQRAVNVTPDSSWWETFTGAAKNLPSSAANLVLDSAKAITDPIGTAYKGGQDFATLVKGSADIFSGNQSPEAEATKRGIESIGNAVMHPFVTAANDPASALLAIGTAGEGGARSLLRGATKAGRVLPTVEDLVKSAEKAKDATYAATDAQFAGDHEIGKVLQDTADAAYTAGFRPGEPEFKYQKKMYPGINAVTTSKRTYGDIPTIRNFRTRIEDPPRGGGMAPDDRLKGVTKQAYDQALATHQPDLAAALEAERAANVRFENTKTLSDILNTGILKGSITSNRATQINKGLEAALRQNKTRRGFNEQLTQDLRDVITGSDRPTPAGGKAQSAGALIGSHWGPIGYLTGAAGGSVIDKTLGGFFTRAAEKQVQKKMVDVIRELNGLPPLEPKARLTPKQRALLTSALAYRTSQQGGGGGY